MNSTYVPQNDQTEGKGKLQERSFAIINEKGIAWQHAVC